MHFLDWTGCVLGLSGSYLLATNTEISRYGWIAFFVANIAMIGFARGVRANGLLVQQLGFMGSSVLGIVRAFFPEG
jgi:hypothetical protein